MTNQTIPSIPPVDTGDLVDPTLQRVRLGDRGLLVALAADPATRARGLMEVEDLGHLDGMLFDFGTEREPSFTMRNTLIALDNYFFDEGGTLVGSLAMVPCEGEPCPSYSIDQPARYALEVPAGSLVIEETDRLEVP